jgi:hypothetical protein
MRQLLFILNEAANSLMQLQGGPRPGARPLTSFLEVDIPEIPVGWLQVDQHHPVTGISVNAEEGDGAVRRKRHQLEPQRRAKRLTKICTQQVLCVIAGFIGGRSTLSKVLSWKGVRRIISYILCAWKQCLLDCSAGGHRHCFAQGFIKGAGQHRSPNLQVREGANLPEL